MQERILFLESFYGGSHKDFADGLKEHVNADIDLHTLPSRFWKWRMRGAALSFAHSIPDPSAYDCVFATDILGLADLKAIWGTDCPPLILYFHENQLSYPVPEGERLDYHFGFTNITSALAADRLVFNSRFQKNSFYDALHPFIRKMPEYRPLWVVDELQQKSEVIYPGCRFASGPAPVGPRDTGRPLLVWNHRWEFDKDPEAFFRAVDAVDSRGVDFDLVLLGENFQMVPKPFIAARERYGSRILTYGYVESRHEYYEWLSRGTVVVSTAIQENYGISVIEAIRMGCFPLLPRRLSYPEILPEEFHDACLYDTEDDLADRLEAVLSGATAAPEGLADAVGCYSWDVLAPEYEQLFEAVVRGGAG